jgi:hypothetical protein
LSGCAVIEHGELTADDMDVQVVFDRVSDTDRALAPPAT